MFFFSIADARESVNLAFLLIKSWQKITSGRVTHSMDFLCFTCADDLCDTKRNCYLASC